MAYGHHVRGDFMCSVYTFTIARVRAAIATLDVRQNPRSQCNLAARSAFPGALGRHRPQKRRSPFGNFQLFTRVFRYAMRVNSQKGKYSKCSEVPGTCARNPEFGRLAVAADTA